MGTEPGKEPEEMKLSPKPCPWCGKILDLVNLTKGERMFHSSGVCGKRIDEEGDLDGEVDL